MLVSFIYIFLLHKLFNIFPLYASAIFILRAVVHHQCRESPNCWRFEAIYSKKGIFNSSRLFRSFLLDQRSRSVSRHSTWWKTTQGLWRRMPFLDEFIFHRIAFYSSHLSLANRDWIEWEQSSPNYSPRSSKAKYRFSPPQKWMLSHR